MRVRVPRCGGVPGQHRRSPGRDPAPGQRRGQQRRDHIAVIHGYRFQTFATNTPVGQLAALEARHRAHARVEDRIRTGKDTGYGRFPSRHFPINAVWLELALTATDLLAWTQTTLLDGELATAEPKKLRYRLLHVAARITRGQRRIWIRIDTDWPWATDLAAAFTTLAAIPAPAPT